MNGHNLARPKTAGPRFRLAFGVMVGPVDARDTRSLKLSSQDPALRCAHTELPCHRSFQLAHCTDTLYRSRQPGEWSAYPVLILNFSDLLNYCQSGVVLFYARPEEHFAAQPVDPMSLGSDHVCMAIFHCR